MKRSVLRAHALVRSIGADCAEDMFFGYILCLAFILLCVITNLVIEALTFGSAVARAAEWFTHALLAVMIAISLIVFLGGAWVIAMALFAAWFWCLWRRWQGGKM